ncbi:MAG: class I SAM-dependent methyltransferase [Acidimicrobiia bacterium]
MAQITACPACGAGDLDVFYEQDGIPVNSMLLLDDIVEAQNFPTGTMRLAWCSSCGFVCNAAYDLGLSEYSGRYEASQAYSAKFQEFAVGLATRWIDKHGIRNKTVLEIGCDKGDFLALMCDIGDNHGIGVDPAATARPPESAADKMELIPDFYTEKYAHLKADVVLCRHTLEHIAPVAEFMTTVRKAIGDNTDALVLFELPDVLRVLDDFAFWDIYYEHCSYFTLGSLSRLFRRTGFEVLHLESDFDGQYLMIEARPSTIPAAGEPLELENDLEAIRAAVERYRKEFGDQVAEWQRGIRADHEAGRTTVIWGGGSKGVAYLTTLGVADIVRYAVDINPFKQNKYLAGSGVKVIGPEALLDIKPDVVIAMNPIYRDEIQAKLDELGIRAELRTV